MFTKEMFLNPFVELWDGIVAVLPKLILAIIVFIIGWLVAKLVYKAIVKLGNAMKLDDAVRPMAGAIEKAGYSLKVGRTIAFLVKWFIIIGTLVVSLDILGLQATKILLIQIIAYIPQVIIAIFVLIAGLALANFTKKIIKGSTRMFHVKSATFLANIARIIIVVFTVLIALDLLIPSAIIITLFTGIVFMFALAGGLAFGLGGRDAAAEAIEEIKKSMQK